MKINTLVALFIINSLWAISPFDYTKAYAMQSLEEVQEHGRISLISQQVKNIQDYCYALKKNNRPAQLVLGVNNGEKDLLERFDDTYIFLDETHENPFDGRSVSINFNALSELEILGQALFGQLDTIILDDSTFKFTTWTAQHMSVFKNMLAIKGKFIFGPFYGSLGITFDDWEGTQEELKNHLIQKYEIKTTMELITCFCVPYKFPINPQAYQEEISDIFEKYKQVRHLEKDEKWKKLREFGLSSLMQDKILQDDNLLWEHIVKRINTDKFSNNFFNKEIVHHNHKRILETVFGQGSVVIEHNKPLPFKSRWREKQELLITAINAK